MPKACNLKKGQIVRISDQLYQVKTIEVHTPSARGANTLYKVRFTSIPEKQKMDQTYKGNDFIEEAELNKRQSSYLFKDKDTYTFMDTENYEQYTLHADALEDQVPWLSEGLEGITVFLLDGAPICIELPITMDLEIIETAPGIKGATATNRNKPATLSSGHTVLVPEYLEPGEIISVNTETGKYMSRAK